MKDATSTTWSTQIIIIFIFIFACFLTLILSYSKAYTIKNRVLTILEKYEGVTSESAEILNNFALEHSYQTMGKCPTYIEGEKWFGAIDMHGAYEPVQQGKEYYYCLKSGTANNGDKYFNVIFFFKFNLPFLGSIATYKIKGTTRTFQGIDENSPDNILKEG